MPVKYITQGLPVDSTASGSGWLMCQRTRDSKLISMPHMLKVNYLRTQSGRDYFIPYEGVDFANVEFSVVRKADGSSYLIDNGQHLPAAVVVFNPTTSKLWYNTGSSRQGPISAVFTFRAGSPDLPNGVYDIEMPDFEHIEYGKPFLKNSAFATTWFRIRPGGANTLNTRYVHAGNASDGCCTVTPAAWTPLFNYLFSRRKGDAISIGTIAFNRNFDG
jgi:hypothetical protein